MASISNSKPNPKRIVQNATELHQNELWRRQKILAKKACNKFIRCSLSVLTDGSVKYWKREFLKQEVDFDEQWPSIARCSARINGFHFSIEDKYSDDSM
jgi:hypothetical protein